MMPTEQLNFFDAIKQEPPPQIKRKPVKTKREYKPFNFDDTCKKLKTILPGPAMMPKRKNSIQAIHEAGKLLNEIRIHKPKMEFKTPGDKILLFNELSFWDYSEKLFNLPSLYVFEYIRAYEIRTLLLDNGFKSLPDCISHIKELWDYTDNQIIDIWSGIEPGQKLTTKLIKDTKNSIRKKNRYYLETLEAISTYTSYQKYLSDYYSLQYNQLQYNSQRTVNTGDYESLKDKYNSLVRDYNISKQRYKTLETNYNSLRLNLEYQRIINSSNNSKQLSKNDCLELLNLNTTNPTGKEIKKAFKEQAFLLHPDHNGNLNDNQKKVFEKEFNKRKQAHDYLISILK